MSGGRGPGGPGTGLPIPRTPLVGRASDVQTLVELLAGGARFVTIVGQGGAGKTRVAIEAASRARVRERVFVDAASVSEPGDVAAAIASALGVIAGAAPLESVARGVGERDLLLVVDNFEHVLAAAGGPAQLLDRCPGLRVLVTSRSVLRVAGERTFRLAPLPVPPPGTPVAELPDYAAVQLLVERTAAVRPAFVLTDDNAELVAALCRRLDGLPLALELCAARLGTFTPATMLDGLEQGRSLALLTRGPRDHPSRQATMRDAIGWSYDLIAPADRILLRRMAVFPAGASLDAIDEVCASAEIPGDAVLEALSNLVDFHLADADDHGQFVLHGTVREFAREQLRDSGEEPKIFDRLAGHVLALCAQAERGLASADELEWLARLDRDYPNIKAVLGHLDGDVLLRAVTALGPYWLRRGRIGEGRALIAEGLSRVDGEGADELRIAAMLWDARLAVDLGDVGERDPSRDTLRRATSALALARAAGDHDVELQALDVLSHVLTFEDDRVRAVAVTGEGIALARRLGSALVLAELLQRAAFLAEQSGDAAAAVAMAREGRDIARRIGAPRLVLYNAVTLLQLAPVAQNAGVSLPPVDEVVALAREVGDQRWIANVAAIAGTDALLQGDLVTAARHYATGLAAARAVRHRQAVGFCVMGAVGVAALRGDRDVAERLHASLRPHLPFLRRGLPAEYSAAYAEIAAGLAEAEGVGWDDMARAGAAYLERVAGELARPRRPSRRGRNLALTARELDVLRLVASGETNKEIAAELGVTAKTVMHHTTSIYRKLGVRSRAEATATAFRTGVLDASASASISRA